MSGDGWPVGAGQAHQFSAHQSDAIFLVSHRPQFDKLRRDREAMVDNAFRLKLAETKMPLRLNTWEARFAKDTKGQVRSSSTLGGGGGGAGGMHAAIGYKVGTAAGSSTVTIGCPSFIFIALCVSNPTLYLQRMAYIAVHKFNWTEFRVAFHRYKGTIITGKNELAGITGEYQEVNMRNVTVSRRKHGVGMYKFADERGFYSGHWRHGLRHGMGTEVNQQGRFQGAFERDWRRGPGSQVYSNGDVYRGPYGGSRYHMRESLLFGDEYLDGQPHGQGKARFVDGSIFDGQWKDGVPTGQGKYVSSAGIVMEGVFGKWATLHGYGSATIDDVTRIGTWRDGLMHGPGTEIDMQAGTYDGDYRHGEKHGNGALESRLVDGRYEGWYHHGYRWGRGVLNYGNVDRDKKKSQEKARRIAESRKQKSRNGGLGATDDTGQQLALTNLGDGPVDGRGMPLTDSSLERLHASNVAENAVRVEVERQMAAEDQQRAQQLQAAMMGDDGDGGGTIIGNDAGDGKSGGDHQTEYQRLQGEPIQFIPYRGDYCYEGRWRAGAVRTGGVFTKRFGRPEPNLHVLNFTHNGKNPHLPVLADLAEQEEDIRNKRATFNRATMREVLEKRLVKEQETLSSWVYWKKFAEKAQKAIRRRTRRGKRQLEEIKAGIKKPERTLGEGGDEEDDANTDYSGSSDSGDDRVADRDEQEFMV